MHLKLKQNEKLYYVAKSMWTDFSVHLFWGLWTSSFSSSLEKTLNWNYKLLSKLQNTKPLQVLTENASATSNQIMV